VGRSAKQAAEIRKEMMHSVNCRKVYIARVQGALPPELQPAPGCPEWRGTAEGGDSSSQAAEDRANAAARPSLLVDKALKFSSRGAGGVGCCVVDAASGKPSQTLVIWLATLADGTHLVSCQPASGHRHQIRCHLGSIGLPIANDALYGGTLSHLPEGGEGASRPPLLPYIDDGSGALLRAREKLSPNEAWCAKCQWCAAHILQRGEQAKRPPPAVDTTEIMLRSWRYVMDRYEIDATCALPAWASV